MRRIVEVLARPDGGMNCMEIRVMIEGDAGVMIPVKDYKCDLSVPADTLWLDEYLKRNGRWYTLTFVYFESEDDYNGR